MKELIDILTDENKSFEDFPWWVYAIIAPIGLVLACAIGGSLS